MLGSTETQAMDIFHADDNILWHFGYMQYVYSFPHGYVSCENVNFGENFVLQMFGQKH